MSEPLIVITLAVIALVGPVLTFIGLRWQRSGRIQSSEAETLWKAAEAIRQEQNDQLEDLRNQLIAQEAKQQADAQMKAGRIDSLEGIVRAQAEELIAVKRRLEDCERRHTITEDAFKQVVEKTENGGRT